MLNDRTMNKEQYVTTAGKGIIPNIRCEYSRLKVQVGHMNETIKGQNG